MTNHEIVELKLKCVELAIKLHPNSEDILSEAQKIYDFILAT